MASLLRAGLAMFSVLALASLAPAQGTLTVSRGLQNGGQAVITFSDPSQANQTVTVYVEGDDGQVEEVEITLDANGDGVGLWDVPWGWDTAVFEVENVVSEYRYITNPDLWDIEPRILEDL